MSPDPTEVLIERAVPDAHRNLLIRRRGGTQWAVKIGTRGTVKRGTRDRRRRVLGYGKGATPSLALDAALRQVTWTEQEEETPTS